MTSQWFVEAYDPGEATGYTYGWFGDGGGFTPIRFETLTPHQVYAKVHEWPQSPDRIRIVESFRLRGSNNFTAHLEGRGLIEVMKYQEWVTPALSPIVWQTPEDKALVPDQLLKDTGLWKTPSQVGHMTARHVNDASIHVMVYLKRLRHQPTLDKYWGSVASSP